MTCDEATDLLIDAVFGDLEDRAEARLREHLLQCKPCSREERALLELRDAAAAQRLEVPAEMLARIAARRRPASAPMRELLGRPVPAYVALGCALLAALLVAVWPEPPGKESTPPREASKATGFPLDRGSLAFTAAESYGTCVSPAKTATAVQHRDSTDLEAQDSL